MIARVVIALAVLAVCCAGAVAYRRWQGAVRGDAGPNPPLPARLIGDPPAPRTWVVFTTPYCATCEPVVERLRRADVEARVLKVDATEDPHLASTFRIRAAPTTLLADARGAVIARLVGAEAVGEYLAHASHASN